MKVQFPLYQPIRKNRTDRRTPLHFMRFQHAEVGVGGGGGYSPVPRLAESYHSHSNLTHGRFIEATPHAYFVSVSYYHLMEPVWA